MKQDWGKVTVPHFYQSGHKKVTFSLQREILHIRFKQKMQTQNKLIRIKWITIIICSFDSWFLLLGSRSSHWTLNRSTCNQKMLVSNYTLLHVFGHQAATQARFILWYCRNKLIGIYSIIIVPVYQLTPEFNFPKQYYTLLLTADHFSFKIPKQTHLKYSIKLGKKNIHGHKE